MIDTVVVAPGEASGSSLAIPKKVGRPKDENCPCRTGLGTFPPQEG